MERIKVKNIKITINNLRAKIGCIYALVALSGNKLNKFIVYKLYLFYNGLVAYIITMQYASWFLNNIKSKNLWTNMLCIYRHRIDYRAELFTKTCICSIFQNEIFNLKYVTMTFYLNKISKC